MLMASVKEAAELLGVSDKTIRRRIKRRELKAERVRWHGGFKYKVDIHQIAMLPGHDVQPDVQPRQARPWWARLLRR